MKANRSTIPPLPPELREAVDQEPPAARAELERVWRLLEGVRPAEEEAAAADRAWVRMQGALRQAPAALPRAGGRAAVAPRRARRRTGWPAWVKGGLGVAAVLAVALIWWARPVTRGIPHGERATISLPDGSTVELGGGSALSYRRGFTALPFVPAARRSVTLRGEAFFDVVPGSRPFVVQTFNARVEVLGTRFNVRAWQDGLARETRVTLVEGRVQVAGAQAEAGAVVLARPGQATRVRGAAAQPAAPKQAAMDYVLAWRQGGFAITEAPLAAVFAELERRFGVTIELRDPLAEADSLTLFFPQPEGVEAILDDICTAKGLRYRPSSRGYVVYRP